MSGAPIVIALHCSGSIGQQWKDLAERLGPGLTVHAPDLYGTDFRGNWPGERPFTLAEEAAPILELIDRAAAPVHLVGHSYGGGLALHLALARPARVASMALYEPSAFQLLTSLGREGAAALAEITALVRTVDEGVLTGAYRDAAARFIDYWNGAGAWAAMAPRLQAALVRYLPKTCLDFRALIDEPTSLSDVRRLSCPCIILRGEHAPRPTRLIAEALAARLPAAARPVIPGAGHMGPLTHGSAVAGAIANFVTANRRHSAETAARAA